MSEFIAVSVHILYSSNNWILWHCNTSNSRKWKLQLRSGMVIGDMIVLLFWWC